MGKTISKTIAVATSTVLVTVILSAGLAAAATTPAQKCEAGKLKASGKYSSCMLAATAKSVTQGESPDYSKCDSTVDKSWMSAEEKGEGMCPGGTSDQAGLQAFLDACNTSVAEALGGGLLPTDVITCNTNVAICNSTLATCNSNFATCSTELTTCGTDLAICNDALAASLAQPHWTCNPGYYNAGDGCDCGCGVIDPDCAGPGIVNCNYCNDTGSCSPDGCPGMIDPDNNSQCGWTCNVAYYGGADGCDCGCGLVDPDCADVTVASCDYCNDAGSCSDVGCPGLIDPFDNGQCIP